jgi:hypothetical protein
MSGDQKKPPSEEEATGSVVKIPTKGDLTVVDEQVAELQEQLAEARDSSRENTFYFILTLIIIGDVFAFPYSGGAVAQLLIAFLEFILLLGLAKKFGVEEPVVFLAGIMRAIMKRLEKD